MSTYYKPHAGMVKTILLSARVHSPPQTILKYLVLPGGTTPRTENKVV